MAARYSVQEDLTITRLALAGIPDKEISRRLSTGRTPVAIKRRRIVLGVEIIRNPLMAKESSLDAAKRALAREIFAAKREALVAPPYDPGKIDY
jgi:hypothetical protein